MEEIYTWAATLLTILYGVLSIIAGINHYNKKIIPNWSALGMSLSGVLIFISAILLISYKAVIVLLLIGLIFLHVFAIINGIHMHGKLNKSHHIFRLFISSLIILFFLI